MNLIKVAIITLLILIPFSPAAAREKLVVGQPAPNCLNLEQASAMQDSPVVLAVFLRGLF